MRLRTAVALLTGLALIVPGAVRAQDVGDRVRVRPDSGGAWITGKIEALRPDSTFTVQRGFRTDTFAVDGIARAELWKPTNPATTLLGSTAGGAVGWWASTALSENREAGAGDLAIGAGIGLAGGLVMWAVDQGDWTTWIEP